MNLQPVADLAERQLATAAVEQQYQRLVARERQIEGIQKVVQPRQDDLLGAHDGRHSGHRRHGRLAPMLAPLAAGLLDWIEAQDVRHAPQLGSYA